MASPVDLFDSTYAHFEADVLARIRRRTFGEDFGQNSWTTAEEYREWMGWLGLDEGAHVLEVASGSGGPALFLAGATGCRLTGLDVNTHGVETARARARSDGLADRVAFRVGDADDPLPFPDASFDAVLCVDSANHFPDRLGVLREWRRVLRPGGRALFTDPVVITGLVTNEELAARSSIGLFVFAPPGVNEEIIREAGLRLVRQEDGTANAAAVSGRWRDARAADQDALLEIEGEEQFRALQHFFGTVHRLTSEGRLSRYVYLVEAPLVA